MRILYITPSHTMYGDNIALMNIMPELIDNGVEPLFMLQREGEFSQYLQSHGYNYVICKFSYNHIYKLSSPKISYIKHFIKETIWNLGVRKYLKNAINLLQAFNPDVIHTNNSANSFGLRLAKELNVPHVWHIREYMDLDHHYGFFPSKNTFEKLLDHPLNTCVCITEDVSNHFRTISQKNVIYDGVIKTKNEPFRLCEKENSVLYVGRLIETKGVYDIVKAFAEVVKDFPHYKLKFLGDGDNIVKNNIIEIAKEHRISEKIELLGYKTNVDDYMKHSKAIVVSSPFEAFGLITAEAMNNGCLVIGKNTAGTKVQFDNGVTFTGKEIGLRYNSNKELEDTLKQALRMPLDIYTDFVSRAYDTVVNFYNIRKSASAIISIYSELLGK